MGELNCLRCAYRHEDNGNCTAAGGFCTAVPAAHCRLLQEYLDTGLTPEEINDLTSMREISPEAEYAINKHADSIIERLDKLLAQTDDDDRLRELAEADKEGRVVVLPCKVGDTVWIIPDGKKHSCDCKVDFVNIGGFGTTIVLRERNGLREQYGVVAAAFGKTVFLTREEAEEALRRAENG